MTNFEHMTEEDKKLAMINGMHIIKGRKCKVCTVENCFDCLETQERVHNECKGVASAGEIEEWLNEEYVEPKTKTEKFCETLKEGEVIAVSDIEETVTEHFTYSRFIGYDGAKDRIKTDGEPWQYGCNWRYGRKLTAEERGE